MNLLLITGAAGLLSGCSGSFAPGPVTLQETPIGEIHGNVHGGNFPVTGAQIYLFAAGQTGYGTSATSLMKTSASGVSCSNPVVSGACYVTTDSNGNFSVGGDYTCTEGQQVYMVAVGGNPGLTGTVNNTAIAQMAGLGQCPSAGNMAGPVPYLVINEVTTVGFAYAMGGFATTPYNVSSDASGETAIANAMKNFQNIVNIANGQAYPQNVIGNSNSVSPAAKINTLANILATCVNQTSATTSACTSLFQYATTLTGTQATDEGSAIFNIVHNQAVQVVSGLNGNVTQNATNLYNLMNGNEPFGPYLASAPSDWTLPVVYKNAVSALATANSSYTSGAFGIAFDAYGNAWLGDRAQGVVEIGPQGATTLFSNAAYGFSMVKGVSVSPQDGSIWVTDFGNSDVYVMSPSGTKLTTLTKNVTGHGADATSFALNPLPTAPCPTASYLAYVAEESSTGIVVFDGCNYAYQAWKTSPYDTDNLTSPGWIAVDNKGAVWIPSLGNGYIGGITTTDKLSTTAPTGALTFASSADTNFAQSYVGVADGLGNLWVPSETTTYQLYQAQAGAYQGKFPGGGMNIPWRAAVDGNNVVWLANQGANTISGFSASLAGQTNEWMSSTGFSTSAPGGTGVAAVGVDFSGDVWAANADGSVTQFLGLGTPTAAPIYGGETVNNTLTTPHKVTYTNGNLGMKP